MWQRYKVIKIPYKIDWKYILLIQISETSKSGIGRGSTEKTKNVPDLKKIRTPQTDNIHQEITMINKFLPTIKLWNIKDGQKKHF